MDTGYKLLTAAAVALSLPAYALPPGVKAVGIGFEGIGEPAQDLVEVIEDPNTGELVPVYKSVLRGVVMSDYYAGGSTKSLSGGAPINPQPPYVYGPVPGNFGITFTQGLGIGLVSNIASPTPGTGQFGPRWKDLDVSNPLPVLTELGDNALYVGETELIRINAGFNDYLSFWYSTKGQPSVEIFGVGADDNTPGDKIVGETLVATTSTGCVSNDYPENLHCRWAQKAIPLSGGVGYWVRITAPTGGYFDNVTFGSDMPMDGVTQIPEPSTYAMLALGLAAVGFAARRGRRV